MWLLSKGASGDLMELDDIYEQAQRDITASLAYFKMLNGLFLQDIDISLQQFNSSLNDIENDQLYFWYRTTVRSFFSFVDTTLYTMKNIILWAYERKEIALSEGEVLIIKEQRPVVRGKKVELISSYNSFDDNLDLSMMYFARVFHSNFIMDKGGDGYSAFKKSLKNRNKVTHPKRVEDYLIPTEGAEDLKKAIIWFAETMTGLMVHCASSLERYQQSLNETP
jgi:hypothetical protein